jgi:conjugal transfer pilus assembly protein TraV
MKNLRILLPALIATGLLGGCSVMTPIGKPDFTCPNEKKGGVCAGPRTIYELTNSRTNLENIGDSEDFDGYVITTDEDGKSIATRRTKDDKEDDHANHDHETVTGSGARAVLINDTRSQYVPRDHAQQTDGQFQASKVIPQQRSALNQSDAFHQWPANQEPLAPEPLSVLEPPKVMRILISSYKDSAGNLHLPGYLYVQVEAETWAFGEAINLRPQRVIPTDILEQSQQGQADSEYRRRGVSPIEHSER